MSGIKEVLKEICQEIIEQNNKPFKDDQVISNHIFDEKGVQIKMGWSLIKKLGLDHQKSKVLNLQFEKKIINKELAKKDYLDIFLYHNGKKIGIELKFKTKGIHITKKPKATQERKEKFKYHFSNQGAETNGHHSFFWDLHRLNDFINKKEIDLGYQIFITNHSSYWKKKKQDNGKKYVIKLDENGNAQISETETKNNSHIFEMSHETPLDKKMDAPNWLSVDNIEGQKKGRDKLRQNLEKLQSKGGKFLYCEKKIKLEHLVDDKIEWLPQKIEHLGEVQDNPARGKTKKEKSKKFNLVVDKDEVAITKFAFVIVELEKKS